MAHDRPTGGKSGSSRPRLCYTPAMRRALAALALTTSLGVAQLAEAADPRATPQNEVSSGKPSGFWGSSRPSKNGAYRYRLLGIGVVLVALTGGGMLVLVRRAKLERSQRNRGNL
jgi:hypothetical protein